MQICFTEAASHCSLNNFYSSAIPAHKYLLEQRKKKKVEMKRAAANPAWSFSFQSENYSLATCWEKEKKISLLCAQFFFLLSAGWEVVNFIGIVRDKGVLVVKLQFVLFRGVGEGKYLKDGSRGTLAICNSFDPMRGTRCALDQRGKFWFVENLWIGIWF